MERILPIAVIALLTGVLGAEVSAQQTAGAPPLVRELTVGQGFQLIHGDQNALSSSSTVDWVNQTERFEAEATANATFVRAVGSWSSTASLNWAGRIGSGQRRGRHVYPLTHVWLQHDEAAGVNFRGTTGAGFGVHLQSRPGLRLTVEGGAAGTTERVPGRSDHFFTLFGGPSVRWVLNERASLNAQTIAYLNGRTGRDLRSNTEADLSVQVSKRVGLQNQFLLFTDSYPPIGFENLNLQATVNVSFALTVPAR